MLACNRPTQNYEDDLKAYADSELPWLRRFAVRRHLTQCASCRKEISAMTQITEELRASEADAPLPSELREKILATPGKEPTQAQAPPLPGFLGGKREGEEFRISDAATSPRPPASGGPLRSNLLRSKEVGFRKPLAWGLAGAALLAWFVMFPMFQKVRENSRRIETQSFAHPPSAEQLNAFSGAKPTPEQLQAAMSRSPISGSAAAPPVPTLEQPLDTTDLSQRQVHKEASIAVQVANPEAASDAVEAKVKEAGGFVVNNTLSTSGDTLKTAELIVKVPVTQFETFLGQVAKLGNVQSKNITGEDLTEQASDASQTEGVLEDDVRQSQVRLNALGSQAKWRDEQAARDLRIQLAQAQARLVLLKRMAALSTITIDLTQTPKAAVVPPVTGGFLTNLKATTHDALQSLLSSGGALLALAIWLLAYAPLWVPALFIGRYVVKEYRRRQAAV